MKTKLQVAILMMTSFAVSPLWAVLTLKAPSKLWIEGDSTLHRWSSASTDIGFAADTPDGKKAQELVQQGLVKGLTVTVPVESLKSGEKGLDKNMQKALKSDKNHDIVFKMSGYQVVKDGQESKIEASGTLSIAGASKDVTLTAPWSMKDGRVIIDGQYPLLMTDYGVKPPTLMLGTIKVDNHVVVKFHLELVSDEPQTDAKQR